MQPGYDSRRIQLDEKIYTMTTRCQYLASHEVQVDVGLFKTNLNLNITHFSELKHVNVVMKRKEKLPNAGTRGREMTAHNPVPAFMFPTLALD